MLETQNSFTEEERRGVQKFHELLAHFCAGVPDCENCPRCGLNLYCYTGPRSITDDMLKQVFKILEHRDRVTKWARTKGAPEELWINTNSSEQ